MASCRKYQGLPQRCCLESPFMHEAVAPEKCFCRAGAGARTMRARFPGPMVCRYGIADSREQCSLSCSSQLQCLSVISDNKIDAREMWHVTLNTEGRTASSTSASVDSIPH